MKRTIATVLLLCSALTIIGCGTFGNLLGHDKIYGGSIIDGGSVVEGCKEVLNTNEGPRLHASEIVVMLTCSCLDLPISIAADTFTLPITVPVTAWHWWKGDATPLLQPPAPPQGATAKAPTAVTDPIPGSAKPADGPSLP